MDVTHKGDREQQVERGENQSEGADGCVALCAADEDQDALQEKGQHDCYKQRTHADRRERESEELDEGSAQVELPEEHGGGPAVVGNMAGVREGFGEEDVRP